MTRHRLLWVVGVALAPLVALGAKSPKPEPAIASAAGLGAYAVRFPTEAQGALAALEEHRRELAEILDGLDEVRAGLKDPRALGLVPALIGAAESSGRSWDYVERTHRLADVLRFLDEEGSDVIGRIASANQAMTKEASCELNLYGSTSAGLKSGVARAGDAHLRAANEAFLLIERQRAPLTRADVAGLMRLADEVARASFLVHIGLIEERTKLRRFAADAAQVKRSADRVVEEEMSLQAEDGRSEAERRASAERQVVAERSRDEVDATVASIGAADSAGALDAAIEAMQEQYRAAIHALTE